MAIALSVVVLVLVGCVPTASVLTGEDILDISKSDTTTALTSTPTLAPMPSTTPTPTEMNKGIDNPTTVTPMATPTPTQAPQAATPSPTPATATPTPTPAVSTNLVVVAPLNNVSAALGQKVTLSWRIPNLPVNPAIDVLYRRSTQTQDDNQTFAADVFTTETGTYQVDTLGFEVGQTYIFTLQLKSGMEVVATTEVAARVVIKSPGLSVIKPNTDSLLLASDNITVEWMGTYLITGASLEAFLDTDTDAINGNEISLKTEAIISGVTSGSMVIPTQDLWSNPKVDQTIYYRVGLRLKKAGKTYTSAYASCMVKLFNGQDFNIISPSLDTNVRFGEKFQITWTSAGIPSKLMVRITLTNRTTGDEIAVSQSYAATAGSATLDSTTLTPDQPYDVTLKLVEGQTVYATRKAAGSIKVTTEGATIVLTNSQLGTVSRKVYIGMGTSFDFTWAIAQSPVGAKAKLYLDVDGSLTTVLDQIEVTPSGGVDAGLNHYVYSPTLGTFTGVIGRDYFVVAKLYLGTTRVAQTLSIGKVHIGYGGIEFTDIGDMADGKDVVKEVELGDLVDVKWDFVPSDILSTFGAWKKIVRLYADILPQYDPNVSIELTDPNTGLDVTGGVTTFAVNTTLLTQNRKYYIIARFFIEGNEEEESQSITQGQLSIPKTVMNVLTPVENIITDADLQSVLVTWEITGIKPDTRKVRVVAISTDPNNPTEYVISDNIDATQSGAPPINAMTLPAGTYWIECRLVEKDKHNKEIVRIAAKAKGKIVIPSGYYRVYDLSDMAAISTRHYSPIDGCVFTGFNIEDQVGYKVAGVGDMNGDGYSDFTVWAKYGQEYAGGKAGEGYLIYGQATFQPVISLNSVMSPDPARRPVNGTIMMMPMENMWRVEGGEEKGRFEITAVPDISGDGKADLIISCPEARPLVVTSTNADQNNDVELVQDHYGQPRTLAKGDTTDPEIAHGQPLFLIEGPEDDPDPIHWYWYTWGDFGMGDTLNVTVKDEGTGSDMKHRVSFSSDHSGRTRGCVYYLTSQRMAKHVNGAFDMGVIGSPVETEGLSGLAQDQMMTEIWGYTDFGAAGTVIPDMGGGTVPRVIISAPDNYYYDEATNDYRPGAGVAMLFNSDLRALLTQNNWTSTAVIPWVDGYPYIYNSSHHGSMPGSIKFCIFGPESYANLTGVSGLGRFVNGNDYSHYVGGDFDGDGVPDVVMGTPGSNNGSGAIYLVYTRPIMAYREGVMDLAFLNQSVPVENQSLRVPIIGLKINGTTPGQALGEIVKSAGDFNGDGLNDIMFITPRADAVGGSTPKTQAGRVIILFGKQNGYFGDYNVTDISSELGTQMPGLIFEGQNALDRFGTSIAAISDVNGDGCDDILVGAPDASAPNKELCGKVYLIYGRKDIIKKDVNDQSYVDFDDDGQPDGIWSAQRIGQFDGIPGAVFTGEAAGDHLSSVDQAGDVNGDGLNDFVLGAPGADVSTVQKDAGKAYLILGKHYELPTQESQNP